MATYIHVDASQSDLWSGSNFSASMYLARASANNFCPVKSSPSLHRSLILACRSGASSELIEASILVKYNACINGARLGRPVEAHRAGTNLMHWLCGARRKHDDCHTYQRNG